MTSESSYRRAQNKSERATPGGSATEVPGRGDVQIPWFGDCLSAKDIVQIAEQGRPCLTNGGRLVSWLGYGVSGAIG